MGIYLMVKKNQWDPTEILRDNSVRTMEAATERIRRLDREDKVQFIVLYGSLAEGRRGKLSDIDLAIGHEGNKKERFNFRLKTLGELEDKFDVQIFQDLPLYIKVEVLKGKVLYARDMKLLNEIALETIREFELFKPHFLDYISRIFISKERG